jgi:hypothetical protein
MLGPRARRWRVCFNRFLLPVQSFFGAGAGDAADAAGHAILFYYLLIMLVQRMQRALLVAMEYHLC